MNAESHLWCARFTSVPQAVGRARRAVRAALLAHGIASDTADTVVLVVSELAANAVRHGRVPGRLFEVRIDLGGEGEDKEITVEVSDAGDARPALRGPTEDAESSRGLVLVTALATAWGVRDRQIGKTVWARVSR
ncbi:ATP-binding protein [Streptomyces ochraceiscleroticus]|uniref:ATP-binding protein n=1 Tax=Streptomyces ochraceiscleroticus TaxID=47761 RepID=A0ABW1MTS3_9ACTN|nr:ATP-binding protein [Streptomyces ochraceiscleroticus]